MLGDGGDGDGIKIARMLLKDAGDATVVEWLENRGGGKKLLTTEKQQMGNVWWFNYQGGDGSWKARFCFLLTFSVVLAAIERFAASWHVCISISHRRPTTI